MVTIELLGRPTVRRDDGEITSPRGAKAWGLLAYLLLDGRPAPRSRLSALLFPDAEDPAATLRWNLAELRRALGPGVELGGDPVALDLPDEAEVDVLTLRAGGWSAAIELPSLGRDLLEGVTLDGAAGFALWLESERRTLRRLTAGLLTDGARALAARGAGDRALDLARRLVDLDPYDEAAHALLVRTTAEVQGPDAASETLADAVRFLERELGTTPSPALTDVLARSLGGPRAGAGIAAVVAQLETGRAAVAAGVVDAGIDALGRAVVGARASGERELLAEALLEVGSAMVHTARGRDDDGAGALHEAAALALEVDRPDVAATAHRELGYIELLQAEYDRAEWWLDEAARLAGSDDGERAWIHAVRSLVRLDIGRYGEAGTEAEQAVGLADRAGDPRAASFALTNLGRRGILLRRPAEARASLAEAVDRARRVGWHAYIPWPESFLAEAELLEGHVSSAEQLFGHAYAMGAQLHDPCWESVATRGLGLVADAKGETDRALDLLSTAPTTCRRLPDAYRWVEGYAMEALTAVAVRASASSAAAWADTTVRFAGAHGLRELQVRGLRHQARLGVEGAAELADALADAIDNPMLSGAADVPA